MFHCYLHGWTSRIEACPICHLVVTWTSSGTGIEKLNEEIFGPNKPISADDQRFLDKTVKKRKKKLQR